MSLIYGFKSGTGAKHVCEGLNLPAAVSYKLRRPGHSRVA